MGKVLSKRKIGAAVIAAVVAATSVIPQLTWVSYADEAEDLSYAQGEVLVEFKEGVSEQEAENLMQQVGAEDAEMIETEQTEELCRITLEEGGSVEDAVESLENQEEIVSAQPNYMYALEDITQGALLETNDTELGQQWYLDAVKAEEGWKLLDSLSHKKVRVAVLDTGVNIAHEDLQTNLNKNLSVDATKYNFPKLKKDPVGHGTHVTGIIGAASNNKKGIAGVASGIDNSSVEIIAVNVFKYVSNQAILDGAEPGYYAFTSDIIKGMNYAAEKGAKVINMSLSLEVWDHMLKSTVTKLGSSQCTIVAAAGNSNNTVLNYPADHSECVSVIAVDKQKKKSWFSNYGTTKDLAAPGSSIYSTLKNGGYGYMNGTSMASPIAAGAAALIYSMRPNLTSGQVKHMLYTTAEDLYTTGKDPYSGYGLVDIQSALEKTKDFRFVSYLNMNRKSILVKKGQTFTLTASVSPANATNKKLNWKSSNPSVASVTSSGKVTAKSSGTATITAVPQDGGKAAAKCKVTVLSVGTPSLTKVKRTSNTQSVLYINGVSGADGYEIKYSRSRDFSSSPRYLRTQRTVKAVRSLTSGKKYYFKVRAYKKDSYGNRVYGNYSNVKSNY